MKMTVDNPSVVVIEPDIFEVLSRICIRMSQMAEIAANTQMKQGHLLPSRSVIQAGYDADKAVLFLLKIIVEQHPEVAATMNQELEIAGGIEAVIASYDNRVHIATMTQKMERGENLTEEEMDDLMQRVIHSLGGE